MFKAIKKILGLPSNPYTGITVRVEKDNLVEYVPGPHVILSKLPFTFPGSCVNVVYMPGYRLCAGVPGRHLFTLLFTDTNPSCDFDNKVRVVLVTQDKEGNLAWIRCWNRDEIEQRIGGRGYKYLLEHSKINWRILAIG